MPAPPEVADVCGAVGRIEVERQANIEHPRQANRHVGVARKIEVELHRVGQRGEPGLLHVWRQACIGGFEHRVGIGRDTVGKHDFFKQPGGEYRQPRRKIGAIKTVGRCGVELRHHLCVVQHRARHQVRKVRHEKPVVQELGLAHLGAVGIHQKSNLREAVERDADGQDDVADRPCCAEGEIDVVDKKIDVFKVGQQPQVEAYAQHQPQPRSSAAPCLQGHSRSDEKVGADREQEQTCEQRHPPAIKNQRGQE